MFELVSQRTASPPLPAVLHAAVARMNGPSSELVWDGRLLRYRAWRGGRPGTRLDVPVVPDPAAWERFWAALDSIGAWAWSGRHDGGDADSATGPGWLLRIERGGRSLDASGLGAYPDGAPGRPGSGFLRVCRELSRLAGDRPLG